ncbi:hypothetical protein llap_6078 [Limosa lapponica baueri]|uniref:Uncharacterized protein n=1 Tax=Limosa lapponica baueri TaxID=1758121 RepID=A0A2I0UC42_LIMLA|nr:hypothetical protein llap_6078 [Limosa lapponica baueri]
MARSLLARSDKKYCENMNQKSFCPKYITTCGKGRTTSQLFTDGKLRFEHEKYWHLQNTFQLHKLKALCLESMVLPLGQQHLKATYETDDS